MIEHIKSEYTNAYRFLDAVLADLTNAQLNWLPPGEANPIKSTLLHVLGSQDHFVIALMQGKPRLWDANDWAKRLGVPTPPSRGKGWEDPRSVECALAGLLEYQSDVRAATDEFLSTLTNDQLNYKMTFGSGERVVHELLTLNANHTLFHSGEMSALKGVQGAKGIPF